MQAGHGFGGRSKAILFMEDILRPQCYGCNCCQGGKLDIFSYKLLKEHGKKKFEFLYKEAHRNKGQWRVSELEEKISEYKEKLKHLPNYDY